VNLNYNLVKFVITLAQAMLIQHVIIITKKTSAYITRPIKDERYAVKLLIIHFHSFANGI